MGDRILSSVGLNLSQSGKPGLHLSGMFMKPCCELCLCLESYACMLRRVCFQSAHSPILNRPDLTYRYFIPLIPSPAYPKTPPHTSHTAYNNHQTHSHLHNTDQQSPWVSEPLPRVQERGYQDRMIQIELLSTWRKKVVWPEGLIDYISAAGSDLRRGYTLIDPLR